MFNPPTRWHLSKMYIYNRSEDNIVSPVCVCVRARERERKREREGEGEGEIERQRDECV